MVDKEGSGNKRDKFSSSTKTTSTERAESIDFQDDVSSITTSILKVAK